MARAGLVRRAAAVAASVAVVFTLSACTADAEPRLEQQAQVEGALPDELQQQMQAAVEGAMAATGSSGAVVGVWAPWSGSWVQAFGTNPDGSEVTTESTFKAGPVTRPMTCDVLYGLAADGVVNLDDPVTTWLESVPTDETTTLQALCNATAGLGGYQGMLQARLEANPTRPWNPFELLAYGLAAPAGTAGTFADADTSYVLLGLALERASGKSSAELFDEYVFEPLGMSASSLPGASVDLGLHGTTSPTTPEGAVDCAASTDLTALSTTAGFTAAGAVTDVTDLGRYIRAMATGLRAYDGDARLGEPLPAFDGAPAWYTATGGTYQAATLVGQFGAVPGYQTAAFADRESGLTVVAVLNNSRAGGEPVRLLGWQLAALASKAPAASGQTAPTAGLPFASEQLGEEQAAIAICAQP